MKINWPDLYFGPVNLNTVVSAYHFYSTQKPNARHNTYRGKTNCLRNISESEIKKLINKRNGYN